MNTLGRSIALLRQYPRLWLPVIVADLLRYGAFLLDAAVRGWLLVAVNTSNSASVLIAPAPHHPALSVGLASALAFSSRGFSAAASSFFYVAALYVTSLRVRSLSGEREPDEAASVSSWPFAAMLRLTGWVLVLCVCVFIVIGALIVFQSSLHGPASSAWILSIEFAVVYAAAAWFGAPFAMRFVADHSDGVADPFALQVGRALASVTVVVSNAIFFAMKSAEAPLFAYMTAPSAAFVYAVGIACSLLSAAPYVVLFIALALLTQRKGGDSRDNAEAVEEVCAGPEGLDLLES